MPSKDDCLKLPNTKLVDMCKAKGVRGYSGKTKEWLVDHCCVGATLPPVTPVPKPISPSPTGSKRRESSTTQQVTKKRAEKARKIEEREAYEERAKRYREVERKERESRAERDRQLEQERRDALNADIRSIKPVGKVKSPSDYKQKEIAWQLKDVKTLDRETFGGPNPVYTGMVAFNYCPESIEVLAEIMEGGHLYNRLRAQVDAVFKKVTIGHFPMDDGMIDRRVDPPVEVLVMDNRKIGIDKMQKALKTRFRPHGILSSSRCFDVEKSTSDDYYGIFLKK